MQQILPALDGEGRWDIPARLNMARQCLSQPADAVAVIDLTQGTRRDVTFAALEQMVDGLARAMAARVKAGDRIGVLLSQSRWCVAAHPAILNIGAISVPLFKLSRHYSLASRSQCADFTLVVTHGGCVHMVCGVAPPWPLAHIGGYGIGVS